MRAEEEELARTRTLRLACETVVAVIGKGSTMDKSMLGDLQSLSEEDNVRMAAMIDQLQIRDRFDFFSVFCCTFICSQALRKKILYFFNGTILHVLSLIFDAITLIDYNHIPQLVIC